MEDFTGATKETGTVEFKNVSFKYPDAEEYLLKDISFKANKGRNSSFHRFNRKWKKFTY